MHGKMLSCAYCGVEVLAPVQAFAHSPAWFKYQYLMQRLDPIEPEFGFRQVWGSTVKFMLVGSRLNTVTCGQRKKHVRPGSRVKQS